MAGKSAQRNDAVWNGIYQPTLFPRQTAATQTTAIQWMIERKFMEIAMNRFKWEGLPSSIDKRWLEMNLLTTGLSVFLFDRKFDRYLALQGAPASGLNLDGNPTQFRVYGNTYYQRIVNVANPDGHALNAVPGGGRPAVALGGTVGGSRDDVCVPIWANYMRVPDWDIIRVYAMRLADIDRTIEINARNARRTKIVVVNENNNMSVQNMNRQIEEGAAAVAVDASLDVERAINAIDLGVNPDAIVNLHVLRRRIWDEAMTMLGINVSNQDKKERLTAAETAGNDDVIATIRATNLNARQDACERINEMWPNLNVSVNYTTDMKTATLKDVSNSASENEDVNV